MKLLITGLIAGTLDALGAILYFLARGNNNPGRLFQYIASAVFGPDSFQAGPRTILLGILFHYLIAASFVTAYFFLAGRILWLVAHPLPAAVLYGIVVWSIMNLVVVPLSSATPRPFTPDVIGINMIILILAIGLPAAFGARWHYQP
jgi:hypothetical protein